MSLDAAFLPYAPSIPRDEPSAKPAPNSPRYPFLDGIRGLAALYVVLFHGYLVVRTQCAPMPWPVRCVTFPFQFGRSAVGLFIVLSGFVLMLPVLRANGALDIQRFAVRRAGRILPPYYAALLVGFLVCLTPATQNSHVWASIFAPAFRWDILLTHLSLLHNLTTETAFKVNISLWSLATEVQIYGVFAALLLPLWRKFGIGMTLTLAWFIGLGVPVLFPTTRIGAPWYLGLFAFGMLAAQVRCTPESLPKLSRIRWKGAALLLWVLFFAVIIPLQLSGSETQGGLAEECVYFDILMGLAATASILAGCDGASWLESRGLQQLGKISFSLYLIHAPLLGLFGWACWSLHLAALPTLCLVYGVGVPVCIAISWLFYRLVEDPSQRFALQVGANKQNAPVR